MYKTEAFLPTVVPQIPELTTAPLEHGMSLAVPLPERAMSCAEAEDLLTAPLSKVVGEPYRQAHLYEGLRAYTYSNNVLAKNLKSKDGEARTVMRQMVPDIRRLVSMLKGDSSHDELILPVRVASDDAASLYARERLVTMKPSRLSAFCQALGVTVNEVALWRLKGSNSRNRTIRLYELEDIGIDSERLRSELISRAFKRMNILGKTGVEVALVAREDVAAPNWLSNVSIGQQRRFLGVTPDDLSRWEIAFRNDTIAKRRIVPVIGWRADHFGTSKKPGSVQVLRPDFRASSLHFDEQSRCLTLFSPVMGAVMLSREAKLPDDLHRAAYEFFGRHYGRRSGFYGGYRQNSLPRNAIAALPALLAADRFVGRKLLDTPTFLALEKQVIPDTGSRINGLRFESHFYSQIQ